MRVLTVYLNGFRICSAGAGVDDNISACATMIGIGEDSSFLQVGEDELAGAVDGWVEASDFVRDGVG